MGGRLREEGYLLMLNVEEQFQTGDPADWVVGLEPPELEVKMSIRNILDGSKYNPEDNPSLRSQGYARSDM